MGLGWVGFAMLPTRGLCEEKKKCGVWPVTICSVLARMPRTAIRILSLDHRLFTLSLTFFEIPSFIAASHSALFEPSIPFIAILVIEYKQLSYVSQKHVLQTDLKCTPQSTSTKKK